HRRRIRSLATMVIVGVIPLIFFESALELSSERLGIFGLWIPIDVKRLDFGAQEMVRATRAKFRQATCVARIDKTQDFFVVLNGADKTLLLAHPATQPRQDRRENFTPPGSIQRLVFRASEGFGVPAFLLVSGFYVVGCFLDKRESQFITFLFVV